jgi:hypothetical protein
MKNTTLFLVFIISMITSWLLFSILWNFFDTNHTYIEVLRRPEQLIGVMFLYWWCPGLFIMEDLIDS